MTFPHTIRIHEQENTGFSIVKLRLTVQRIALPTLLTSIDIMMLLWTGYHIASFTRSVYVASLMEASYTKYIVGICCILISLYEHGSVTNEIGTLLLSAFFLNMCRSHMVATHFARRTLAAGTVIGMTFFSLFYQSTPLLQWWTLLSLGTTLIITVYMVD